MCYKLMTIYPLQIMKAKDIDQYLDMQNIIGVSISGKKFPLYKATYSKFWESIVKNGKLI